MSDNIIAMARASGFARSTFGISLDGSPKMRLVFDESKLEAFAQLVAADERERCALACEAEHIEYPQPGEDKAYDNAVDHCASAIRALGERT